MDAHVGTFLEATLDLHTLFEAVVGQSWVILPHVCSLLYFPGAIGFIQWHFLTTSPKSALPAICLLMQDRVQSLQDEQPERGTWRTAVIGKEAFQLWEFSTNKSGWCLQSISSPLYPFSLDTESAGFQFFVRWLATDLKVCARVFP